METRKYTPEEQFAAGLDGGLSPREMLANVDRHIERVASSIANECKRCPAPDYAATYIREQAETAIHLRELRGYVLSQLFKEPAPCS